MSTVDRSTAERALKLSLPILNHEYANCISKSIGEALVDGHLSDEKLQKLLKKCAENIYVDRVTANKAAAVALLLFFAAISDLG